MIYVYMYICHKSSEKGGKMAEEKIITWNMINWVTVVAMVVTMGIAAWIILAIFKKIMPTTSAQTGGA